YELDEDGNTVNTIELIRGYIPEDEQDENDTVFPGGQIIYYGGPENYYDWIDGQKFWLNDNHTYLLNIAFPNSEKVVTSESILVNRFDITYPSWFQETVEFTNNPNSKTLFKWEQPNNDVNNAFRYEVKLLFHYQEKTYSGITRNDSVLLASIIKDQSQVNDEMIYNYHDQNFFISCLSQILHSDPAIENTIEVRYTKEVEFIVSVAAEDFNVFIEVYTPSGSIVQEKPPFTNIENGIGLFSARYNIRTSKDLHTNSVIELIDIDENIMKFEY
ncbi:MAG: hypothetical protein K8R86_00695, partial [Bacteroidales bacterium]|nr:hypothetical protein [Bacteroidales bacterium]